MSLYVRVGTANKVGIRGITLSNFANKRSEYAAICEGKESENRGGGRDE